MVVPWWFHGTPMEHQHETKNNREQHKINNAPPEPRNRFYKKEGLGLGLCPSQ